MPNILLRDFQKENRYILGYTLGSIYPNIREPACDAQNGLLIGTLENIFNTNGNDLKGIINSFGRNYYNNYVDP